MSPAAATGRAGRAARAPLLGGRGLADLAVARARRHLHRRTGRSARACILAGPAQRLAEPLVQLNLVATFENRRADLRLRASTAAPLALAAEGLVDLGAEPLPGPARRRPADSSPARSRPTLAAATSRLAMILNGAVRDARRRLRAERRQPHLRRRPRSRACAPSAAPGCAPRTSSSRSRRGRTGSSASTRSPAARSPTSA